jgi:hypothetical protein
VVICCFSYRIRSINARGGWSVFFGLDGAAIHCIAVCLTGARFWVHGVFFSVSVLHALGMLCLWIVGGQHGVGRCILWDLPMPCDILSMRSKRTSLQACAGEVLHLSPSRSTIFNCSKLKFGSLELVVGLVLTLGVRCRDCRYAVHGNFAYEGSLTVFSSLTPS